MTRSLLLLGAAFCLSAQNVYAQCTVDILNPPPSICLGQSYTINATPGADSYVWYADGTPIAGANTDVLTGLANTPGTILYEVEAHYNVCVAIDTTSMIVYGNHTTHCQQ